MLKSLVVAFSTYSKIPMPRVEWDEKSMKYSMCWFPFVGVVIGLASAGCFYGLSFLSVGHVFGRPFLQSFQFSSAAVFIWMAFWTR